MVDDFKTPDIYRRELTRMEAAMREQIEWLKDWHLYVFSNTGDEQEEFENIAEFPFKAWYGGLPQELFAESPIFVALGFNLESMQTLANQFVRVFQESGHFPEAEYGDFMDSVSKFNDLVFKLMRESLNQVAHVDDLTGVGNETGMRAHISAERERVRRTNQQACVALAELGEYTVPDEDGLELDPDVKVSRSEVISRFAQTVEEMLRPYDQLYRIDNDDFVLCLPYTDTDVANLVVNRLHAALVGGGLGMEDGTKVELVLRFGIAPIGADDEVEDVMEHAREAVELARANALLDVVAWYVS
jgi:diguanylate cyclase (GGDEF)-like protein|tara:strand:- start:89 stop:994 length:906 start_codon:yes stop_codon:yes gene_type:complete